MRILIHTIGIVFFISWINIVHAQKNETDKLKCKNNTDDNSVKCVRSSFSEYFSSIKGLDCYFDFDEGLQCAKISDKPCIVYFTEHNSFESREMESELLTNSEIIKIIRENYIFIKLIKDDKMKLTPFYQVISSTSYDTITLFGKKSTYYQERLFHEDVTPAFYIIDLDKTLLTNPVYYSSSLEDFKPFLQDGIKEFKPNETNHSKESNFVLRIHRNNDEPDYYRLKGGIEYSDFVSLFKNIDWETEFFKEIESESYNFSDIEVINENSSFYLSISIGPSKETDFQYIVGFGYHQKRIDQISRIIKIYGSQATDQEKIVELIEFFFCNDIDHLARELEKLDFLIEMDDVYNDY